MSDGKVPDDQQRDLSKIATATTLGFGVAVSLAVLVGGGVWLDQKLDVAPLFTLLGLAFGVIAAGYQLYELALVGRTDRDNGPIGRAITRRVSRKPRGR